MAASKPVHEIRFGLIVVSIWRTMTKKGPRYNSSLRRLYKNGDVWTKSQVYGEDDLLLAAKALDHAHTWIHQKKQADGTAPAVEVQI